MSAELAVYVLKAHMFHQQISTTSTTPKVRVLDRYRPLRKASDTRRERVKASSDGNGKALCLLVRVCLLHVLFFQPFLPSTMSLLFKSALSCCSLVLFHFSSFQTRSNAPRPSLPNMCSGERQRINLIDH